VCVDYARVTTAELVAVRPRVLRTYRKHVAVGNARRDRSQDITVEVAVDQLPTPSSVTTQADWLRSHGIATLVADARAVWDERAAIGDLERSGRGAASPSPGARRPDGPGGFLVMEWLGRRRAAAQAGTCRGGLVGVDGSRLRRRPDRFGRFSVNRA